MREYDQYPLSYESRNPPQHGSHYKGCECQTHVVNQPVMSGSSWDSNLLWIADLYDAYIKTQQNDLNQPIQLVESQISFLLNLTHRTDTSTQYSL